MVQYRASRHTGPVVVAAGLLLLACTPGQAAIRYVKWDATGANNGTSWVNAYTSLQSALAAAVANDEIWVARGTYKPTTGTSRTATFQLKNGVALYGGFNGTETQLDQRNIAANETTLSGDLASNDGPNFTNMAENSYHVVSGGGTNATAVLDGFTIRGGNANSFAPNERGGGLYISGGAPTIRKCKLTANSATYGGGMFTGGSPAVHDCTFSSNRATSGAGMYTYLGSAAPVLNGCAFQQNTATSGGGMFNDTSNPSLTGCVFNGNSATDDAGGMYNLLGTVHVTNTTFEANQAVDSAGAIANDRCSLHLESSSLITNSARYGAGAYSYSCSPLFLLCTFDRNGGSLDGGGAVNLSCTDPRYTQCSFTANTAGRHGGAVYSYESRPVFTNGTFTDNTAVKSGAGVMNNHCPSVAVSGCVFEENVADEFGGGVYNDTSPATVSSCVFRSNTAMLGGGSVDLHSNSQITDSLYVGNATTTGYRGGAANEEYSASTFTRCRFFGNQAGFGAAMRLYQSTPVIINCLFSGNHAVSSAGVMYIEAQSNATLINCTLSRNSAALGGGVYNDNCALTVVNSILWGNREDTAGLSPQIAFSGVNAANNVRYSNIENYDGSLAGAVAVVSVEPQFGDPDGPDNTLGTDDDNLRLRPGSPCIDAGDSTAVPPSATTDLDGHPRLQDDPDTPDTGYSIGGPVVDLGCYEGPHEVQAFLLAGVPVTVPEGGTATFTVRLRLDPLGTVTAAVIPLSGDADITVHAGTTLVFDSSNFSAPQEVTLAAAEDADFSNGTAVIRVSAAGIAPEDIIATESDNEPAPPVVYVNTQASGQNIGTSWIDAFTDLQAALAAVAARPGVPELWVAAGRYTPAGPGGSRAATFNLINGVGIYGGFAGGETAREQRDPAVHETILSGDLNGDDGLQFTGRAENSYHVVSSSVTDNTAVLDGFTISGGYGNAGNFPDDSGAGMYNYRAAPVVRNCIFRDNLARKGAGLESVVSAGGGMAMMLIDCVFRDNVASAGGALVNSSADLTATRCTFTANVINADLAGAALPPFWRHAGGAVYTFGPGGNTVLVNCTITGNIANEGSEILCGEQTSLTLRGDGTVDPGMVGSVVVDGRLTIGQSLSLARGTYLTNPGGELVLQDDVVVDLGEQGSIVSGGMLRVKDRVTLANTSVSVTRASFEGGTIISNNVISAEAGVPAGQFFIEDTVRIQGNDIYSDGDRYLDLDPSLFGGLILGNRIFVTITEGVGQILGGLLELRAQEQNCPPPPDPCGPGVFQAPAPQFDLTTWTIDRLELVPGAKVNLTNRFDFQPPYDSGGGSEVMYVKELRLRAGAVLNTAYNRLYYETLQMDPAAQVVDIPLLGFSLGIVAFNDDNEFVARVRHNNFIDPDPEPPDKTRIHAERITGQAPDPAGMMELRALADADTGEIISARAKGTFARAAEDEIVVAFQYLFRASAGDLIVYLTDSAELLETADPLWSEHYVELARIRPPAAGQPGCPGGDAFATFYGIFPRGSLNFLRGTYVELELQGEGAMVRIDNWDPQVICRYECASFDGVQGVTEADFLILLAEYGHALTTSDPKDCLDSKLSRDRYIDWVDLMNWDTYKAGGLNSCGAGGASVMAASLPPKEPAGSTEQMPSGGLLVSGKSNGPGQQGDSLYTVAPDGTCTASTVPPAGGTGTRANGRLVQDSQGQVYQIHGLSGLVRLEDGQVIVGPRSDLVSSENTVLVGVTATGGGGFVGIPMTDAVFHPANPDIVYVAPVLVSVPSPAHTYKAVARLMLDPAHPGQYSLGQLYGTDPWTDPLANTTTPPEASPYNIQKLREIEIDRTGARLYVTSSQGLNSNEWMLVYDAVSGAETRIRLTDLSPSLKSPEAMLVSGRQDKLYLSSSVGGTDSRLFRLSIAESVQFEGEVTIPGFRQITAVSENPTDGRLHVLGFQVPDIPEDLSRTDPLYEQYFSNTSPVFTTPLLATVQPAAVWADSTVQVVNITAANLALPISALYLSGARPADLDLDGDVDGHDCDLFEACSTGPGIPYDSAHLPSGCTLVVDATGRIDADFDRDGDVDQSDFAVLQTYLGR